MAIRLALHLGSLGVALVGRHWFTPAPHIGVAAAWVLAIVARGDRLLRGTGASRRYATAVLVTIAIRLPFFAWFEPHELRVAADADGAPLALGARTARRRARDVARLRTAGIGLLVTLAVWVLAAHAPNTWKLRQRTLAQAIATAVEAGGPRPTTCRWTRTR